MSTSLKVAVVQLCSVVGKIDENLDKAYSLVQSLHSKKNFDLVVFPEVFATGYSIPYFIENSDKDAKKISQWICDLCNEFKIYSAYGVAKKEGDKLYNRAVMVDSEGNEIGYYNKTNLFNTITPPESCVFEKGSYKDAPFFDIKGFKTAFFVCYDLRFPEVTRWYYSKDVNLMINMSAFLGRVEEWRVLNQARAVENATFICASNHAGPVQGLKDRTYAATSMIVSPTCDVLCESKILGDDIIYSEIEKEFVYEAGRARGIKN